MSPFSKVEMSPSVIVGDLSTLRIWVTFQLGVYPPFIQP